MTTAASQGRQISEYYDKLKKKYISIPQGYRSEIRTELSEIRDKTWELTSTKLYIRDQYKLIAPKVQFSVCRGVGGVRPFVRPSRVTCHAVTLSWIVKKDSLNASKTTGVDVTLHAEFDFGIIFARDSRELGHPEIGLLSRYVTLQNLRCTTPQAS